MTRVGAVDGLFAVNLDDAAVLNVPRILQLVEDVTGLVFDQQSRAGRPEHQRLCERKGKKHKTIKTLRNSPFRDNFSCNNIWSHYINLQAKGELEDS